MGQSQAFSNTSGNNTNERIESAYRPCLPIINLFPIYILVATFGLSGPPVDCGNVPPFKKKRENVNGGTMASIRESCYNYNFKKERGNNGVDCVRDSGKNHKTPSGGE